MTQHHTLKGCLSFDPQGRTPNAPPDAVEAAEEAAEAGRDRAMTICSSAACKALGSVIGTGVPALGSAGGAGGSSLDLEVVACECECLL